MTRVSGGSSCCYNAAEGLQVQGVCGGAQVPPELPSTTASSTFFSLPVETEPPPDLSPGLFIGGPAGTCRS